MLSSGSIFSILQSNLAKQQVRLDDATAELDAAQATLNEKEQELAEVQASYEESVRTKQVSPFPVVLSYSQGIQFI